MATPGHVKDGLTNHCSLQPPNAYVLATFMLLLCIFGRLVRDFIQVIDYVQLACWHRSLLESNA